MKNELIEEVIASLYSNGFTQEQANMVRNTLLIKLERYTVQKDTTELTIYEGDINENLVRKFLITKRVAGRTDRTLQCYGSYLRLIFRKIKKSCLDITTDDIRLYLAIRETRDNLSKTSLNNELRVLRTFYLNFSKSKAEKMMSLAAKAEDENSIFSKTETFTDIGISKVWALLAAPEDVAEQVMENPQAADMSVREFKDEIRRLKEKNANLEDTIKRTSEETTAIEITLQSRIKELEADLENYKDANPQVLEMMTTEMKKLRVKLEKEKERVKKLKDSADTEKEKAAAEARAAAEEEARKKFEQETMSLQESNQEAAAEIDRLTRKLANSSNGEMASFKAYADQLQKAFGACVASIGKVEAQDQQQAAKMRDALRRVMENLVETI